MREQLSGLLYCAKRSCPSSEGVNTDAEAGFSLLNKNTKYQYQAKKQTNQGQGKKHTQQEA